MHMVAGSHAQGCRLQHMREPRAHARGYYLPYNATSPYQAHLAGLEVGTCGIGSLGVAPLGCERPAVDARLTRGDVAA